MSHLMDVLSDWGLDWKQTGKKKGEPDNIYSRVNWEQLIELASILSLSKEEKKELMIELVSEKMLSAGGYISISDLNRLRVKFQKPHKQNLLPEKIIKQMMFVCHHKSLMIINRAPIYILDMVQFARFMESRGDVGKELEVFRYTGVVKEEIDRLDPTFELSYVFDKNEALQKVEKFIQEEYAQIGEEVGEFDITVFKQEMFESILRDNPKKAKKIKDLLSN